LQNSIPSQRLAGVLLHPTSLPNIDSLGTLDEAAFRFIDFLDECGVGLWQVLPLNPTDQSLSPYSASSAFAGNTRLISRKHLVSSGFISEEDVSRKLSDALSIAFDKFSSSAAAHLRSAFDQFCETNHDWLEDFALYSTIKTTQNQVHWVDWPEALRKRDAHALGEFKDAYRDEIQQVRFEQFVFFQQWQAVHQYANSKNIAIFGDMPIFVAHDSADVWANQSLFKLNDDGQPSVVAGVPPDYFSEDGQRWGNPLYNWSAMADSNFAWWLKRMRHTWTVVDYIRIDHFRGFDACWQIPVEEETAKKGVWEKVPGEALFHQLFSELGNLPLVAEDLGIITPEVDRLRRVFGIPGMKVLQFAFDGGSRNPYLPHNHEKNSVAFSGTHDNDTTLGWFNALESQQKKYVRQYLGQSNEIMPWPIVSATLASVATWAIVPFQDVLCLDHAGRMNTPGTTKGNWQFQFRWDQLEDKHVEYLRTRLKLYGRHKSET